MKQRGLKSNARSKGTSGAQEGKYSLPKPGSEREHTGGETSRTRKVFGELTLGKQPMKTEKLKMHRKSQDWAKFLYLLCFGGEGSVC